MKTRPKTSASFPIVEAMVHIYTYIYICVYIYIYIHIMSKYMSQLNWMIWKHRALHIMAVRAINWRFFSLLFYPCFMLWVWLKLLGSRFTMLQNYVLLWMIWVNFITTEPCSPEAWFIMVHFFGESSPFMALHYSGEREILWSMNWLNGTFTGKSHI